MKLIRCSARSLVPFLGHLQMPIFKDNVWRTRDLARIGAFCCFAVGIEAGYVLEPAEIETPGACFPLGESIPIIT